MPVVGPHEAMRFRLHREGPPRRPDAGVDHGQEDGPGREGARRRRPARRLPAATSCGAQRRATTSTIGGVAGTAASTAPFTAPRRSGPGCRSRRGGARRMGRASAAEACTHRHGADAATEAGDESDRGGNGRCEPDLPRSQRDDARGSARARGHAARRCAEGVRQRLEPPLVRPAGRGRRVDDGAREVARSRSAPLPAEIVFTASGTEADNLAPARRGRIAVATPAQDRLLRRSSTTR